MTILVTGGAGYIGSHMTLELLQYRTKVNIIHVPYKGGAGPTIVDIVGAVSLLATQEALDQLTKRAKGEKLAGASEEAD